MNVAPLHDDFKNYSKLFDDGLSCDRLVNELIMCIKLRKLAVNTAISTYLVAYVSSFLGPKRGGWNPFACPGMCCFTIFPHANTRLAVVST